MILSNVKNYDLFVQECRFFFCQDIFEGDWDGKEKFIIASDSSEEELRDKYPEMMEALSPYFLCSSECGEVYAESKKNIDKFRKRELNTIEFGSIEVVEAQIRQEYARLEARIMISEGLMLCTPLQRERIRQHFFEGMTLSQIANGKNISVVQQSISAGIKRMKKYFGTHP